MTIRAGDVVTYTPKHLFRRDGYAIAHLDGDRVTLRDTFDNRDTTLTDEEAARAQVLFNLDEFPEVDYHQPEHWHPADFFTLPTRKGLAPRHFRRAGAKMLSESDIARRAAAARDAAELRARAELLSPLTDQAYAATPLPRMTIEETGELRDTLRWVHSVSRAFTSTFDEVMKIQAGRDGNIHVATVLADTDHYSLVRARRALDKRLAELRA